MARKITKQTAGKTLRKAIRDRHSWMADGDFYEFAADILLEFDFVLIDPSKFGRDRPDGLRGSVYANQHAYAYLSHGEFMGEFTDLQFSPRKEA